jgi:hypothetical protein
MVLLIVPPDRQIGGDGGGCQGGVIGGVLFIGYVRSISYQAGDLPAAADYQI